MAPDRKRVFVTDCEGPITKNDNAAELADTFIAQGDRFFAKISLYDDYLAEVVRRPGYKAGDTLRLILPFFRAYGLDDESILKFSRHNIAMIPDADAMLREVAEIAPAYIVSTSYSPYVKAVCEAIRFPFANAYSTEVNLDRYTIVPEERNRLKEIAAEILGLPDFTLPSGASSAEDLSDADRETVTRLDEIFWAELPLMESYAMVREVNPIGGREKARAVEEIAAAERVSLNDVIYVGDSITDVDAFRLVRSSRGMTVSFNGNDWAVREVDFAVTAQSALPIGWLADLFLNKGVEGFQDLLVTRVTPDNMAAVSASSSRVRKEVRTEKIGSLG